jgi:transcription elongation factor Elf1
MDKPRQKRDQKPVKTKYFQGTLACQRCANAFVVSDLNEHRKVIACSVCGAQNDIQEAKKRAA